MTPRAKRHQILTGESEVRPQDQRDNVIDFVREDGPQVGSVMPEGIGTERLGGQDGVAGDAPAVTGTKMTGHSQIVIVAAPRPFIRLRGMIRESPLLARTVLRGSLRHIGKLFSHKGTKAWR
jgi:hypothetical protein